MDRINNSQLNLLDELAELYPIMCIIDSTGTLGTEVYISHEHITPTITNTYLSIRRWTRITSTIESNSMYVNNQNSLAAIVNQIDMQKYCNRERKFDANKFTWIKF